MRTLPREPWRGSQICGEQIEYGTGRERYCAERKGSGLPMCPEHFQEAITEYGTLSVPEDVALGATWQAVRLLWEPYEGDVPIEPSYEEMARYAGAHRGGE